jgi:hypothetical protein
MCLCQSTIKLKYGAGIARRKERDLRPASDSPSMIRPVGEVLIFLNGRPEFNIIHLELVVTARVHKLHGPRSACTRMCILVRLSVWSSLVESLSKIES